MATDFDHLQEQGFASGRGLHRAVLFGHNSANQADRLRPLLDQSWIVESVQEDAPQHSIDEALSNADVLVSRSFDERHRAASGIGLLQVSGAGLDRICMRLVPEHCAISVAGGHETAIAEYVVLTMLDSMIDLRALDRSLRSGSWAGGVHDPDGMHDELAGKTIGIVGYGTIGREIAKRLRPFGVTVGAFRREPGPDGLLDWSASVNEPFAELPHVDFLVVACPLTVETRGLIDARWFAKLPSRASVINVARAQIIEECDLYRALQSRRLCGAVLDVWPKSPTPNNPESLPSCLPFDQLDNVVMTPHASGWTQKTIERKWRLIAQNIQGLVLGRPLQNVVRRCGG